MESYDSDIDSELDSDEQRQLEALGEDVSMEDSSEEGDEFPQVRKKQIPLGDDSSDDEIERLERRSKKIDDRRQKMEEEAELEAKDLAKEEPMDEAFIWKFPTEEELQKELETGKDLSVSKERISQIIAVLADFKKFQYKNTPRHEYVDLLKAELSFYYGYLPYLIEKALQLFPPAEAIEYLDANEVARPTTIRVNTLKTRRKDLISALKKRGVNLDPIPWSKEGVQIFDSTVPIGATPEYLAGHYMIQSASSWLPVIALDPQPKERILDMAAAPGGKTTYIAAHMKNTGQLFANDASKERIKALSANVHRMGVTNCTITHHDGREIPSHLRNLDRVLLDAPCSGLGVVSKDPSVKINRDGEDILRLAYTQKQLLLAAIDAVDARSPTGGIIVYSTCSISIEENEWVVDYALRKRSVKLVETGLEFGKPGIVKHQHFRFDESVRRCRRVYPHVYNMDGFFIAKFKKFSNDLPGQEKKSEQVDESNVVPEEEEKTPDTNKPAKKTKDNQKQHKPNQKKNESKPQPKKKQKVVNESS